MWLSERLGRFINAVAEEEMNQWAMEGTNEKWTDEYIFVVVCIAVSFVFEAFF